MLVPEFLDPVCREIAVERQLERTPDEEAKEKLLHTIATHSPMSWAHVNMLGEYDFSDEKLRDSVGVLPPKSVA